MIFLCVDSSQEIPEISCQNPAEHPGVATILGTAFEALPSICIEQNQQRFLPSAPKPPEENWFFDAL